MATISKPKNEVKKAKNPCWIRFMAPVIPQTVTPLLQIIDQALNEGHDHLHLLLSTNGGSVFHGLSAHNFLRGLSVPLTTYNFGTVDSIGVVMYCSGSVRQSVPHARFLIHPVLWSVNGQLSLREKDLEEHVKSVKIDGENIARVISDTTGKPMQTVEDDMQNRTTLNPKQAKEYGLVTQIGAALYPGGRLFSIYETGQVFQSVPTPAATAGITSESPYGYNPSSAVSIGLPTSR